MPVYVLNGITIVVNRTINEDKKEEITNGLFNHFMNVAINKLEESENDGGKEPTSTT